MNVHNVTRLLTYLEQLKASGEEDKWEMGEYLCDRARHEVLFPSDVTNWHCGTAGCLAGSWAILRVKDGYEPPETPSHLVADFTYHFGLTHEQRDAIIKGHWSPHGLNATLDEAIDYLRLCLTKGTMDVSLA